MFDLKSEKSRARVQAKRARAAVVAPDAAAVELLAHFPISGFRRARIGGVWPLPGEVDTRPLLEALSAQGCSLSLPCTPRKGKPLIYRAWSWGEPLRAGPYGTREPLATAPIIVPDVVLVPLLAFDAGGGRLGYGGGFYDRTLARLRASNPAVFACGVGFAAQKARHIPTDAHDQKLDGVLTERGFTRFGKN